MNTKYNRGFVLPWLAIALVVGATQLVPNWRLGNVFKKAPPTAELVAAQKAEADAKAQATALQGRLDAVTAQNEAKKQDQLTYTHEMVTGAIEANAKAPDSTEKAITDALLQRADIGFNAAVGKLDPALRTEVIGIVAQLRSGDQAKITAANAMLAEKDKELAADTAARVKLEADAVVVKKERDQAVTLAATKAANETKLTAKVVAYSDKAYANEQKAGSFGAWLEKLAWVLGILIVLYVFIHVLLPLWAQSYPAVSWLQKAAALGKNLTTAHP